MASLARRNFLEVIGTDDAQLNAVLLQIDAHSGPAGYWTTELHIPK